MARKRKDPPAPGEDRDGSRACAGEVGVRELAKTWTSMGSGSRGCGAGLIAWYERGHRALPWREDRDPYRILVSEMMLVQTTVAAVVPYLRPVPGAVPDRPRPWPRPTRPTSSRPGRGWAITGGPGSSRRRPGRSSPTHGGVFPDDPEAIRALPGVGRYIAGAGALVRLRPPRADRRGEHPARPGPLARLGRGPEVDAGRRPGSGRPPARLVPEAGAGTFNQAFMELGALVCIPRAPLCLACPVAGECLARGLGVQDRIPVATPEAAAAGGGRGLRPGRPRRAGS